METEDSVAWKKHLAYVKARKLGDEMRLKFNKWCTENPVELKRMVTALYGTTRPL